MRKRERERIRDGINIDRIGGRKVINIGNTLSMFTDKSHHSSYDQRNSKGYICCHISTYELICDMYMHVSICIYLCVCLYKSVCVYMGMSVYMLSSLQVLSECDGDELILKTYSTQHVQV